MDCDFCKRTFSSKSNLLTHQKTTKYCIEMQGKQPTYFECEYCNKKFTSHQNQIEHACKERERENNIKQQKEFEQNIKSKYELKIQELEYLISNRDERIKGFESIIKEKNEYIAKLEARLVKFETAVVNLASEPKTTKTTTNAVVNTEYENKTEIPIPLHEQMSSIVIEEIKDDDEQEHYSNITLNNVVITSRPIDHYVNATQLCQAGGKKFSHWFSLDTTKELISELSTDAGITASALVETKRGGNNKSNQGSWIHPELSIQLAQWISPKFAIQVSKWIRTLFNQGSIEIDLNLLREKERDMRIKDHRIKQLESVCLSKQRRIEYP